MATHGKAGFHELIEEATGAYVKVYSQNQSLVAENAKLQQELTQYRGRTREAKVIDLDRNLDFSTDKENVPQTRVAIQECEAVFDIDENDAVETNANDKTKTEEAKVTRVNSVEPVKRVFRLRPQIEQNRHLLSQRICGTVVDEMRTQSLKKLSKWGTGDIHEESLKDAHPCLIRPSSKFRACWGIFSLFLLTFDLVFVPMDICFTIKPTVFTKAMNLTSRIFWSLDIPISFNTAFVKDGEVITSYKVIARHYSRSWFPFDFCLVVIEWALLIIVGEKPSPVSILRAFRWSRLARLLRVLRFIKFQKLKPLLRGVLIVSSDGMDSLVASVKAFVFIPVGLHCLACLWHLLGSLDNGWVNKCLEGDSDVGRLYVLSVDQMLRMEFHKPDGETCILATHEYVCIVVAQLCMFVFSAYYIGLWTNMVVTWFQSDASQKDLLARNFIRRHSLSWDVVLRIGNCLTTFQIGGVAEALDESTRLKAAFPMKLNVEINYEVRHPVVCSFDLFDSIHTYNNRYIRGLCHRAMKEEMSVGGEVVFKEGDACSSMYFSWEGTLVYRLERTKEEFTLERGYFCAEAALWTPWEHCGRLDSISDAMMITLDTELFVAVTSDYSRPKIHIVKYAVHFCWRLNRSEPSDILNFNLTPEVLDTELFIGGLEDHFTFISHYKVEAGTEATLLRDELEAIVRDDVTNPAGQFRHPIFIDSEELVDLTRLTNHVKGSLALMVLLSPGILTRPWCLLEIAIAKRSGRPFVPVLLVRPGLSFSFPNEEFYSDLNNDKIIDGGAHGRKLLEDNGVTIKEVEVAIRALFMMIALPLSPHKSSQVRKAEMMDILARCLTVTSDAIETLGLGAADPTPLNSPK